MELPREIQEFVLRNIDSVAELEGLLLFFRHPDDAIGVSETAAQLYVTPAAAEDVVRALLRRGFLVPAAADAENRISYRYQPGAPEVHQLVAQLAELYSRALIPITQLIHTKASSAITQFADAFRLRERK